MTVWILIGIAVIALLIVLGIMITVVVYKKKKEGMLGEPNYRSFCSTGIVVLAIGIVFMVTIHPGFIAFIGMGVAYLVIGLAHRDKWEQKRE
jgi:hypothetical protein